MHLFRERKTIEEIGQVTLADSADESSVRLSSSELRNAHGVDLWFRLVLYFHHHAAKAVDDCEWGSGILRCRLELRDELIPAFDECNCILSSAVLRLKRPSPPDASFGQDIHEVLDASAECTYPRQEGCQLR